MARNSYPFKPRVITDPRVITQTTPAMPQMKDVVTRASVLTRGTSIPRFLAALSLQPTATTCRPNLVYERTSCETSTTAATTNSSTGKPPSDKIFIWRMSASTLPIRMVRSWVTIFPTPRMASIMPSVVRKAFIFSFTMSRLLSRPTTIATASPALMAIHSGEWRFRSMMPHTQPDAYPTAATERSRVPASRAKLMAQVMSTRGAPLRIVP